jgi:hypothetical protein
MKTGIALVLALIAGCAASNTGVVPIGGGLYMLGSQDYSLNYSGSKVKAELYREAAAFCEKQGKQLAPVSDTARDAALYSNYASAEIKFRCQ